MTVTPSTVVLRDEAHGRNYRHLVAYLDDAGDLHIDGNDLGPATAGSSDEGEDEWFTTYAAADLPAIVALLDGAPGAPILALLAAQWTGHRSHELEWRLREIDIPADRSVWS